MKRNRRSIIARRCPVPWTPSDEAFVLSRLAALRADVDNAGGLDAWLRDRIELWLEDDIPECRSRTRTHR